LKSSSSSSASNLSLPKSKLTSFLSNSSNETEAEAQILQQQIEKEDDKFNNLRKISSGKISIDSNKEKQQISFRQRSKTNEQQLSQTQQHRFSQQKILSEEENESIIIPQKVPLGFGSSSERQFF
jgi:hypothetical protein